MLKKIIKKFLWRYNYDISKINFNFDFDDLLTQLSSNDKNELFKDYGPINQDGTYSVPEKYINDIDKLITLGVGPNFNFEREISKKNINITMFDASVTLNEKIDNINFVQKFVRPFETKDSLGINEVLKESIFKEGFKKIMLKMDIEGDEYSNLLAIEENLLKYIDILIIEFHYLNRLVDKSFNREAIYAIKRLLKYFRPIKSKKNTISSIYGVKNINVPKYLEVTLINKLL